MALQESNGYRLDIVPLLHRRVNRKRAYMAGRQSSFFFPQKDVRDTWWFQTNESTAWLGWRKKQKTFFGQTRPATVSFPTPKLGAKTRPC